MNTKNEKNIPMDVQKRHHFQCHFSSFEKTLNITLTKYMICFGLNLTFPHTSADAGQNMCVPKLGSRRSST